MDVAVNAGGDISELSPSLRRLKNWTYEKVADAYEEAEFPNGGFNVCHACVVWGEKYVRRFLDIGLPSLMAEGNFPAIKGWLNILTDKDSLPLLIERLEPVRNLGMRITIDVIPEEGLEPVKSDQSHKYWIIGAGHNLQLKQAKYKGHHFHLCMPDHVYSKNYMRNMKRLFEEGHQAIIQGSLSAAVEKLDLENDGVLSIEPKDLIAMGINNLHEHAVPFVINGKDIDTECPVASFMMMVGENSVHKVCPHYSPMFISHDILMDVPMRLFNTVDSQLPFILPDDPYLVRPEDDMAYLEISDSAKLGRTLKPNGLLEFALNFWMMCFCERAYLPYLDLDEVLPLPEGFKTPYAPMSEDEIRATKKRVRDAVKDHYDAVYAALEEKYRQDPLPREKSLKFIRKCKQIIRDKQQ